MNHETKKTLKTITADNSSILFFNSTENCERTREMHTAEILSLSRVQQDVAETVHS